jgi:hypothetical protein
VPVCGIEKIVQRNGCAAAIPDEAAIAKRGWDEVRDTLNRSLLGWSSFVITAKQHTSKGLLSYEPGSEDAILP